LSSLRDLIARASETPDRKKNTEVKSYGGDISRKEKIFEKQLEKKQQMKQNGEVETHQTKDEK
jgi:translation elongation factor EF-4